MTKKKIQTRCNMYLDEENVATIKDFLKGTGMTFSSYVDLLIKKTANTISDFYINLDYIDDIDANDIIFKEENGVLYFDIQLAHKLLCIGDDQGFAVSESQQKKINDKKWRYDYDPENKRVRLIIGKTKKDKPK